MPKTASARPVFRPEPPTASSVRMTIPETVKDGVSEAVD